MPVRRRRYAYRDGVEELECSSGDETWWECWWWGDDWTVLPLCALPPEDTSAFAREQLGGRPLWRGPEQFVAWSRARVELELEMLGGA